MGACLYQFVCSGRAAFFVSSLTCVLAVGGPFPGQARAQAVKPSAVAKPAGDAATNKVSVPLRQPDAVGAVPPEEVRGNDDKSDDATGSAPAASASPQPTESAAPKSAKPRLVVSSWGGAYGKAQQQAIVDPLSRSLGLQIERRTDAGNKQALDTADVAELDQSDLIAACRAGRLVKMRTLLSSSEYDDVAGVDGSDFMANSFSDCGLPTFAWSSILIANGAAMKKLARRRYRAPSRLSDLLRPKRFPGKRALIRSPKRVLEMVTLANGVAPEEVYQVLATRDGQDQAFKLLDGLSKHILWVDGPREALLALDEGKVTIAMTFSGRAFRRLIASTLLPIWDGHIIDYASWVVPVSSANRDGAKRFILAATSAESLAAQARIWPYGPMRRSALPLARRHDMLDTELARFMPTSEMRFDQGLVLNAAFWAEHGAKLHDRFDAWLEGVPLGIRVPVPIQAPPPPALPVGDGTAPAPQ